MRTLASALLLLTALPALAEDAPPDAKSVYQKRCAGCHGEDGKAQTRQGKKHHIDDFTKASWAKEWTAEKVASTVTDGVKGKMPAFKEKLTPAEVQAVSAYVLTFSQAPAKADAPAAKPTEAK